MKTDSISSLIYVFIRRFSRHGFLTELLLRGHSGTFQKCWIEYHQKKLDEMNTSWRITICWMLWKQNRKYDFNDAKSLFDSSIWIWNMLKFKR